MQCVICKKSLLSGVTSVVRAKGLAGLKQASEERGDGLLHDLPAVITQDTCITVHLDCR